MYPKLPFSFTTTYMPQDTNYNYNNTHQMELYHHCLGGSAAPPLTQLLLKAAVKMEALVAVSQVLAKDDPTSSSQQPYDVDGISTLLNRCGT